MYNFNRVSVLEEKIGALSSKEIRELIRFTNELGLGAGILLPRKIRIRVARGFSKLEQLKEEIRALTVAERQDLLRCLERMVAQKEIIDLRMIPPQDSMDDIVRRSLKTSPDPIPENPSAVSGSRTGRREAKGIPLNRLRQGDRAAGILQPAG